MAQETMMEGKQIISKFWHNIQETKANLCQRYGVYSLRLGKVVR